MRRSDLAINDNARIDEVILSCDCFRLAFADGTRPYIVPLSFGYRREEGLPVIYFHSAAQGRKVDLSRSLRYAGFEFDTDRAVKPDEKACDFSMRYACVIGEGKLEEITEPAEKAKALNLIMTQYSGKSDWAFPEHVLAKTVVFRLTATEISGREHG